MRSDADLVRAVGQGDGIAFAELCTRWERPLYRFLHRCGSGDDADDLFQETWMRVVRSASRFDPERRFSTWLFQIAVNLCRDWHRRSVPAVAHEQPEGASPADSQRVEAGIDAGRLLARLSESQREVLILRYYHDLPESEIAAILDCPKGTVKSRIHNALARLSEIARAER